MLKNTFKIDKIGSKGPAIFAEILLGIKIDWKFMDNIQQNPDAVHKVYN